MADRTATYLYTETRLNLDESHAGSTIQLTLDPLNPRRNVVGPSPAVDEAAFARQNLANDASIFFRPRNRSLRSFLWRLLDERKVLELQCVDLTQELGEDKESIITLRLDFGNAVRPYCLALADHAHKDALVVFAITTAGEFVTVNLSQDCFVHTRATEVLSTDWCKITTPASLRTRKPYRLTAIDHQHLLISLNDGSLLRWQQIEHALPWTETYYSSSGWNVLPRALARLKGDSFVRFGDTELDPFTVASVVVSPEEQHIITVCLNHTLRIWNAQNGRVVLQVDLLDSDEFRVQHQQQQHKYLISPNQRQLLQVLDVPGRDGDQYYIATFSPKQQSFTFWAVLDAESGPSGVRQIQTSVILTPPMETLMQSAAWNLEEFHISANRGWSKTTLWLRARSGPVSRMFSVNFPLFESDSELSSAWTSGWTAVSPGQQTTESLSAKVPTEVQPGDDKFHFPGATEQWLDFLFYPNRFTSSTLQTALYVYVRGTSSNASMSVPSSSIGSLQALITSAISRKAAFHQIGADHDQRELKISEQWHIFYGLVQDLHKRRSMVVSFIFDAEDRLPWIVAADCVSPVRLCNDIEISTYHRSIELAELAEDQISKHLKISYEILDLLHVSSLFGRLLTTKFVTNFKQILLSELLADSSASVGDRISALRSQIDLGRQIGDEEWSKLFGAIDEVGGYDILDFETFNGVLEQFDQQSSGRQISERLVRYGTKAVVRTTQENLLLHTGILLDLLLLVIFVETEIEPSELQSGMQNKWRGQDLYINILRKLRGNAVLDFLMKTTRVDQIVQPHRQSVGGTTIATQSQTTRLEHVIPYTVTLLESLFIGDWSSLCAPEDLELPELLTYLAASWVSSFNIDIEFDELTTHVLADLIKHGDKRLANSFLTYVPTTGWSTYLKGRLSLLRGEHEKAADYFTQAACAMSRLDLKQLAALNSAQLLRPDECEQLTHGRVGYFEHIMNLFDHLKLFSHVVEFAQFALQQQSIESAPPSQSKKTPRKSPQSTSSSISTGNLLSRLFTAALDSAQYDIAYSALVRLPDALRKACLQCFVDTMIHCRLASRLLSYPFTDLSLDLDIELAQKTHATTSPTSSGATTSYHKILYALRIQEGNFRGAAQCLWDYAAAVRIASGNAVTDPRDQHVHEVYLMLINALSCCGVHDAWVLDQSANLSGQKRRVVYIEEVRAQYQALVKEASELNDGKFAFAGDDSMEVDA